MYKVFVFCFVIILLNGVGCSSSVKTGVMRNAGDIDKYMAYRDMALENLKGVCLTQQGRSCWGFLEKECVSNFIHYQNVCSVGVLGDFPMYPTKEQKIKLSGEIGGCVFKKRSEHSYKLEKINMKSCQSMRLNGRRLFNEGRLRFNEILETNKELNNWINNN
jgi:hypothetical protein